MKPKLALKVEDELWARFKSTVPKSKTLSQAVVELIEQYVSYAEDNTKPIKSN